jgi:hypothetical protein
LKTGSGQYKPTQSNVLLDLDFIVFPQAVELGEWHKKPFASRQPSWKFEKEKRKEIGVFAVTYGLLGDFYRLRWTLSFACQAFYAVLFSCGIRFLFRSGMPWRISPVEQCHRTDFNAHAITCANIPVDCNSGSMYALLLGWFNGSPNVVTLMLAYNFAFLLKVRIYRQDIFTYS